MFSKKDTLKVKGVAILFLLFHHLFWDYNYVANTIFEITEEELSILCPTAYAARLCVWMFVFLSAYGLTIQYKNWDGTSIHFITKRLLALLSNFFFVFPFATVFVYLSGTDIVAFYNNNIFNVILDFFALSDFFATPTLSPAWWYMCLTQFIICIIPICCLVCKKVGVLIIPYTFIFLQYSPGGIGSLYGGAYTDYLLAVSFGVYFATENVFDKILIKPKKKILCFLDFAVATALCVALLIIRDSYVDGVIFTDPWKIASSNAAVATVLLVYVLTKYVNWKPLEKILIFLGKHSGNMYLIHTIFYINLKRIVYWNSNGFIVFCTLLVLSLVFSIIIEFLKNKVCYDKLICWVEKHTHKLFIQKN